MCSRTLETLLDKLYYSYFNVKFTVDVVRDDVIRRGYVTDVADDGLIIDFHNNGPSSRELVEFSCIRTLPSKKYDAERYLQPLQVNSKVEVLVRDALDQPLTWRTVTFMAVVPEDGDRRAEHEGGQFIVVRLQSRNPFSLAVVNNVFPPTLATDIRIRQTRFWRTVTPKTFYKVTVPLLPYAVCNKGGCTFPRSSLLYYMKLLDVSMKIVWLEMTSTLIISADDVSVTVLCRVKTKRLPKKFHRLVYHLYNNFMERYLEKGGTTRVDAWLTKTIRKLLFFPNWLASKSKVAGALIFKGISQDHEALPTIHLHTLPDILLRETLQNLDRITQTDLKRVCRRWSRLQSSVTAEKCVILDAPTDRSDHPIYLARALLKYTAISTRSLILKQFPPSHSYTAMRLIKEMQLQLEVYVSYRCTVTVYWLDNMLDLFHELCWYPAVNNLHISCIMKSKAPSNLR
ncbi:uncharacterized protein LOC129592495 [Paramacrobiotus metropolitanus]|uniref:uncharacterized protein LOC129592495 n=1 Tax=Paramacrobiotus metropolitanus TaxID=2943436 RepID=UPI002445F238|nr:uncharacterized protein LOC129592495 [Paramacrobiotus metropolitanus]